MHNYRTLPNYRRILLPAILLGLLMSWFFSGNKMGLMLLEMYLPEQEYGPLELPTEAIIEEFPPPVDWYPDSEHAGLFVILDRQGVQVMERLRPPWIEHEIVPIGKNSQVGGCSFDGRLVATTGADPDNEKAFSIVACGTKEVLARFDPLPAPADKLVAWHPKSNALAIGGTGHITLLAEPDWQPRKLATAERDYDQWAARVKSDEEETTFSPNENVSQLIFSDDGQWLICAMDRGLRVYSWDRVQRATTTLPPAKLSVDGELVHIGLVTRMKMTCTTQYDAARKRILWAGLEGALSYLDLETQSRGTLLTLPKGYVIRKMQLVDHDRVLACEIDKIGKSTWPPQGLFLLDYRRLVQAEAEQPSP